MAIGIGEAISIGGSVLGALGKSKGGKGGGGISIAPAGPQELAVMQPVQREASEAAAVHTADDKDLGEGLASLTEDLFSAWFMDDEEDLDEDAPAQDKVSELEGI